VVVTQRALGFIPISRMVGWRYTKDAKRPAILKVTGAILHYDALLPDSYGMKAQELAALMEAWRRQISPALADQPVFPVIKRV
jgi:hypothetical protein